MMQMNYKLEKDIPVVAETDVLVIGGGPGGVSAAVMAARRGMRVTLAERFGAPGGMAYIGEVSPFMSNHLDDATLDRPLYVDWNRKMWECRGLNKEDFDDDVEQNMPLSKDIAMLAAEDLLEEAGVQALYHHTFFDVIRSGGRIQAAVFHTKSGLCAIRAQMVIDSTGDGDVAVAAGCPFEFGNGDGNSQPMTLCFKLSCVERSRMPERAEINRLYDLAKAAGEIHCPRENVLWFPALEANVIHFNTTRIVLKNGTRAADLSDAEKEGRRQLREIVAFMRRHVPGFENAQIHSIAVHVGIRESRRIGGKLFQTVADFHEQNAPRRLGTTKSCRSAPAPLKSRTVKPE